MILLQVPAGPYGMKFSLKCCALLAEFSIGFTLLSQSLPEIDRRLPGTLQAPLQLVAFFSGFPQCIAEPVDLLRDDVKSLLELCYIISLALILRPQCQKLLVRLPLDLKHSVERGHFLPLCVRPPLIG